MRKPSTAIITPLLAVLCLSAGSAGCYTAFSPAVIRGEIARQTGQDPQGVFELSLGRPTMALARAVLAGTAPAGPLPLDGVAAFQLAVYEVPGSAGGVDFTTMPIRGWEPTVKFREGPKSGVVLVRAPGEHIGDLVVVAGGSERIVYARLRGRLSRDLPDALGRTIRSDGPEAIQRSLMSLTEPEP